LDVVAKGRNKLKAIVTSLPREVWWGPVLDVGCGNRNLQKVLDATHPGTVYRGADIVRGAADPHYNIDIGQPLSVPFGSIKMGFRTVTALDVLEHVDDIYRAFLSVCDLSERYVVISLPNLYHAKHRWSFLRGRIFSGKYGLPHIDCGGDRHRWLFTLEEAVRFVHKQAVCNCFVLSREFYLVGPRIGRFRFLAKLWPGLFVRTYVALLERRSD